MPVRWTKVTPLDRAAQRFVAGDTLLGDAAHEAGVTTLELMEHLAGAGYRSPYAWEDFVRGTQILDAFLDYHPPKERQTPARAKAKTKARRAKP